MESYLTCPACGGQSDADTLETGQNTHCSTCGIVLFVAPDALDASSRYTCPGCEQRYELNEEIVGLKTACVCCDMPFVIVRPRCGAAAVSAASRTRGGKKKKRKRTFARPATSASLQKPVTAPVRRRGRAWVAASVCVAVAIAAAYYVTRPQPQAVTEGSGSRPNTAHSSAETQETSTVSPKEVKLKTQTVSKAGVVESLAKNDWALTDDVRRAYLQYAESTVLGEIDARGVQLAEDFIKWVRSEPDVYDAAFGAIYPPDQRILLNMHQLRNELGPKLTAQYKQLIIGASVTRRMIGVSAYPMERTFGLTLKNARARDRGQVPVAKISPAKAAAIEAEDKKMLTLVEGYLKSNRITAAKAYSSAEHNEAIMALLNKTKAGKKLTMPQQIVPPLHQYVISTGQQPAERDPFPSVAEFIRYLDNIFGQTHKPFKMKKSMSTWPLFPVDKAPWPILMPLSRTMPLREAEYIWEKYNGLHGGENRYHRYGPYRRNDKAGRYRLQPSEWHRLSWPSISRVGGLCGTMSSISMFTDLALGKPSLKAGQPGHSCIVLYNRDEKGFFNTAVSQGVKGAETTGSAWCFADLEKDGAGMDYHYGLSLAVNKGLDDYMSARIGVHLYKMLSQKQKDEHGMALLLSTAEINPYHPEVWYQLAEYAEKKRSPKIVIDIFNAFYKAVNASMDDLAPWVERAADEAIEDADMEAPSSVKENEALYAKMVMQTVIETALQCPVPQNSQQVQAIIACMDKAQLQYGCSIAEQQMKYKVAVDGMDTITKEASAFVKSYYANLEVKPPPRKRGQPKPPAPPSRGSVADRILVIVPHFQDVQKRIAWLEGLKTVHDASNVIYIFRRQGPRLDEAYLAIYKQLMTDYKTTKDKEKLVALKKEYTTNHKALAEKKAPKGA